MPLAVVDTINPEIVPTDLDSFSSSSDEVSDGPLQSNGSPTQGKVALNSTQPPTAEPGHRHDEKDDPEVPSEPDATSSESIGTIEVEAMEETPDDEAKPVNSFPTGDSGCIMEEVEISEPSVVSLAVAESAAAADKGKPPNDDDDDDKEMPGLIEVDDEEPFIRKVNKDGCVFTGENKKI